MDVRYTGIILDDFESELNTKTPERRAEIKKWVVSTVYPALEETPGNEGWIWLSGTIVHFDSFLQMICDGYNKAKKNGTSYTWDLTFMRAIMDGEPAWADQHHAYEYKCENKFGYIADRDNAIPVNVYIGVDLAATASETSDYQVILVVAVDSNNNRYVLEYFRERIPTFDVPLKIIEMTKKYHPVKRVTIETVAAQEMVRDMVTRLSATERRLMPGIFKGVKPPPGIKKQDRLETSLGPMINSKKLYVREEMTELVDEVFEHPKPRHDDILDALYYADRPGAKKLKWTILMPNLRL